MTCKSFLIVFLCSFVFPLFTCYYCDKIRSLSFEIPNHVLIKTSTCIFHTRSNYKKRNLTIPLLWKYMQSQLSNQLIHLFLILSVLVHYSSRRLYNEHVTKFDWRICIFMKKKSPMCLVGMGRQRLKRVKITIWLLSKRIQRMKENVFDNKGMKMRWKCNITSPNKRIFNNFLFSFL